jgi:hypothetical protein
MAVTLFEVVNPNGNIQAVVESDDDACYFYLFAAPDTQFGMRSVWVRNHRGGRQMPSKLNACGPGPPRGIPLAIVVILQVGLHPLLKTCESSGSRKATVRHSTKEARSSL